MKYRFIYGGKREFPAGFYCDIALNTFKYKHEEAQRFLLVSKLLRNCCVAYNHARTGISLPFLAGVRKKVEKQPQI